MRILHLYSDWKWTGPAEPALQTCRSLLDRGHEVLFACCEPDPEYDESIVQKAEDIGVPYTTQFGLDRYMSPTKTVRDAIALPRFLRQRKFDVIHCHLNHDHVFGALCSKLAGRNRPAVVRSLYKRNIPSYSWGYRFQFRKMTDGFVAFTPTFRQKYISRFGFSPQSVAVSPMPVDLDKFRPGLKTRDMRKEFGIPAGAPLVGIVGRFQEYRRADVFLQAAARVLKQIPNAYFMVIGRSSQLEETVISPMHKLGIQDHVSLPGYRQEDYVDTLACLDVFSLLMPGFDGTARAVREAMALGKPCVVSDFGMLPEIVPDGTAGFVVDSNHEALADGWLQLFTDPELQQKLGQGARETAEKKFRIADIAPILEPLYEHLHSRPLG